MFITGSVRRMRDIEDLYPTRIARALGINHSRYIDKLNKPGEFAFKHISNMAQLLDIDIQLIIDVIKRELNQPGKLPKKKGV